MAPAATKPDMPTPDLEIEWEAPKKWVRQDENEWDVEKMFQQ